MPEDEIEEKINELEKSFDNRIDETADNIEESNGFLTKKNGWIDKSEWHATAMSIAWASLAFAFTTPFDALFIVTYAIFMKRIIDGKAFDGSQLGDIRSQFAYSITFYSLTSWAFILFTDRSVESIDVGRMIITALVGA